MSIHVYKYMTGIQIHTCTSHIKCDHSWQNKQRYCADYHFWEKTTIANYNIWTSAATKQICVSRNDSSCREVKIATYHPGRLFWLRSQISVQRNIAGFAMDNYIILCMQLPGTCSCTIAITHCWWPQGKVHTIRWGMMCGLYLSLIS